MFGLILGALALRCLFPGLVSSLLHATENRCYLGYITSQSTHILSHVIFFDLLGLLLLHFFLNPPSPPPPPPLHLLSSLPECRGKPARLVHGGCGPFKFTSSVLCHRRARGARCVGSLRISV